MIRYVPYHKIERVKYDDCIRHSIASRIYAFSWYLDCVTDRWDLLVQGDYDLVMPLPRKTKYGISYVYTPSWVQQLGLFSSKSISDKTKNNFLKMLSKNFLWIDYHLNSNQEGTVGSTVVKQNHLISLQGSVEEIHDHFNKNRKRALRRNFDHVEIDKNGDINVFIENYKNQYKPYAISEDSIDRLRCLCIKNKDNVQVWNVFDDNKFLAGLVWLKDAYRVTYLAPLADEKAKKLHIPTYLINELIKDFHGQNLILDFEGSMVAGVENFYKSFGAYTEPYYYLKKRILNNV